MLRAAKAELTKAKATVEVVRVPGAFEIPAVASALALRLAKPVDAIGPSPCDEWFADGERERQSAGRWCAGGRCACPKLGHPQGTDWRGS